MPKRTRRALAFALALSVSLLSTTPASAGMPTDRVRGFFEDVNRIIADPAYDDRLADRIAALRALLADMIDFRSAAAAALGSEWAARAPQEREEFVRLFTDLLQTSVVGSVGARARLDGNGVAVTYVGELADGPGVTVATTVLTRSGEPMGVGYRMSQRSGRWLVYDVVVDGVSLVENYRAQFHKVMHRSSYNGLVGEMRTRIVELGRIPGGATASATPVPTVRAAVSSDGAREATTTIPAAPAPVVVSAAAPAERLMAPERRPAEMRSLEPKTIEPRTIEPRPIEPRIAEPRPLDPPSRMHARLVEPSIATVRPPAVAAPSVTPRAAAPTYWVQVGAFRSTDMVMRVVSELRDEPVSLVTEPGRQPLLRVLVGPFADRGAATAKLREVRGRGYSAFIPETLN
jgi:phospholipid transport system substrate-binding protein